MAMQPGTKKWSTLARMSDQEVLDYFTKDRGLESDHAYNCVRKLRSKFTEHGTRRPPPCPTMR